MITLRRILSPWFYIVATFVAMTAIKLSAAPPVVAVDSSGKPIHTVLVEFTGTTGANPGSNPYGNLVQGVDGNFYGMTNTGGTTNRGTVFKLTSAGVTTLVDFTSRTGTNPGADSRGHLVQGSDGNFYGMTGGGGQISQGTVFRMTPAGTRTTLWEFTGNAGANPGGFPTAAWCWLVTATSTA